MYLLKLFANVNIGVLEKGVGKAQKSYIVDSIDEARHYQAEHGGRISTLRKYEQVIKLDPLDQGLNLDEDNYVDVNHYEILYNTLQQSNSQWAYSLRKIVTSSKEFVTYDMCENLGYLSHVWVVLYQLNTNPLLKETFKDDPSYYLIDTNCYLIEKSVLQKISYNFQRPARQHPEADRMLFDALRKNYKGQCTMAYTLNYRLDGRRGDPTDSAISEFYIKGNEYINSIYNNNIPWKK